MIKTADWVIDLGPEGGGGEIVAQGTPEDIVKAKRSYTGQYLKPVLERKEVKRKKGVQAAEGSSHTAGLVRRYETQKYSSDAWT